jgi:hypothetical protein
MLQCAMLFCTSKHTGPRQLSRYSDLIRAGRSGDRIPVGGGRFSATVQTGPGAHPASYTMGTASLPRIKRPGSGVDHPPSSSAEVKERLQLYIYSPLGLRGLFYLYLLHLNTFTSPCSSATCLFRNEMSPTRTVQVSSKVD